MLVTPPPVLPVVSGFVAPTADLCSNGGQTVTITGTGFTGTSAVQFNAVNAASFIVVNSTTITAVTPSGLTAGIIAVTNSAGTGNSTAYTVAANPSVAVSPTSGAFCIGGTAITLTASGASTYAWAGTGTPVLSAASGNPVTASPTTATTITVTGTDANGCKNTATASLSSLTTPAAPTTTPYSICVGGTVPGGQGLISSYPTVTASQTINFTVSAQPTETNAAPGNIVASAAMTALPAGATVTGITINYAGLTSLGGSYGSDIKLGLSGALINDAASGVGAPSGTGVFTYTRTATTGITGTPLAGGTVNLLYWDDLSDNAGAEATFPTGTAVASVVVTYSYPDPSNVKWYDLASAGTLVGSGTPFDPVTAGAASNASAATYTFYAEVSNGGSCPSTRTAAVFTVSAGAGIATQPSSAIKCAGQTATFTVAATGAGLTYKWFDGATQLSNGAGIYGTITGATSATLSIASPTGVAGSGSYTVEVSSACGSPANSFPAVTLTINALPTVAVTPTSASYCTPGGTPISLAASGASTYTWTGTNAGLSTTTGTQLHQLQLPLQL